MKQLFGDVENVAHFLELILVLIVDFKTDQPAPESPEGVAVTYRAQMAAYWAVLRRAYPGRRIRTALCWTDGPRLMFLPEEMLLEALKGAQSVV